MVFHVSSARTRVCWQVVKAPLRSGGCPKPGLLTFQLPLLDSFSSWPKSLNLYLGMSFLAHFLLVVREAKRTSDLPFWGLGGEPHQGHVRPSPGALPWDRTSPTDRGGGLGPKLSTRTKNK